MSTPMLSCRAWITLPLMSSDVLPLSGSDIADSLHLHKDALCPHHALSLRSLDGVWLVYCCLTAFSAQIGYIMPYQYEIYQVGPGNKINIQLNSETIE